MEARRRFSSRRPSRHPLHGRNDMKTSKKRFSRQKHAHKQRKQGLSCHHAPPLYNHSSLSEEVWIHGCGTLRCGQAPSGAVRNAPKRSASILVQPSSSTMTVTIATRAKDTLHCFNGLQQPQRPSRPQAPEEPQRPQGWMLSFDSPPPIPQLSVKNQNFWLFTFSRFLMDANRNFLQCRCKAHCVNANTVITSIPKKRR